jgi:hypothetical protein
MLKDISKTLFFSITEKQFLPIWGVLIIVMVTDVTTRLNTENISSEDKWQITDNAATTMTNLQQQETDDILTALTAYEVAEVDNKDSSSTIEGMSAAEQAEQQGLLGQLYIGDLRYRLVGVFTDKMSFAILQQKNIVSGEQVLIKVKANDMLKHYKVEKILTNQVIITSNTHNISLDLYKKQLASEK